MIRRFLRIQTSAHLLFFAVWFLLSDQSRLVFERWAVTGCATLMTGTYLFLTGAYFKARKTRLNSAMAINKFYLFGLFGVLTLPSLWGIALRDAPYRIPPNPYTYWTAPALFRTYLFVFLSFSTFVVLFEFYRVNWGAGSGRIKRHRPARWRPRWFVRSRARAQEV